MMERESSRREPEKSVVFVVGFPPGTSAQELAQVCLQYGAVTRCDIARMPPEGKSAGYVRFASEKEAGALVASSWNHDLRMNGSSLKANWARSVPTALQQDPTIKAATATVGQSPASAEAKRSTSRARSASPKRRRMQSPLPDTASTGNLESTATNSAANSGPSSPDQKTISRSSASNGVERTSAQDTNGSSEKSQGKDGLKMKGQADTIASAAASSDTQVKSLSNGAYLDPIAIQKDGKSDIIMEDVETATDAVNDVDSTKPFNGNSDVREEIVPESLPSEVKGEAGSRGDRPNNGWGVEEKSVEKDDGYFDLEAGARGKDSPHQQQSASAKPREIEQTQSHSNDQYFASNSQAPSRPDERRFNRPEPYGNSRSHAQPEYQKSIDHRRPDSFGEPSRPQRPHDRPNYPVNSGPVNFREPSHPPRGFGPGWSDQRGIAVPNVDVARSAGPPMESPYSRHNEGLSQALNVPRYDERQDSRGMRNELFGNPSRELDGPEHIRRESNDWQYKNNRDAGSLRAGHIPGPPLPDRNSVSHRGFEPRFDRPAVADERRAVGYERSAREPVPGVDRARMPRDSSWPSARQDGAFRGNEYPAPPEVQRNWEERSRVQADPRPHVTGSFPDEQRDGRYPHQGGRGYPPPQDMGFAPVPQMRSGRDEFSAPPPHRAPRPPIDSRGYPEQRGARDRSPRRESGPNNYVRHSSNY